MSNNMMGLIEFHKVHDKLGAKEIILDVRNPDEYAQGHIPGSKNIPLPQIGNHVKELQEYSKVYIHCKRGGRAKTAYEALSNAGLKNLVCIHDAGMDLWMEKGFPVA